MEREHVQKEQFEKLHRGVLTDGETKLLLQHCSECEYCTDRLTDSMAPSPLIKPPGGMKSQILEKAAQIDKHRDLPVIKSSKQLQLFFYSLKVAAAAVGTCAMLLSIHPDTAAMQTGLNGDIGKIEQLNSLIFKQKIQINEKIYEVKNKLGGF